MKAIMAVLLAASVGAATAGMPARHIELVSSFPAADTILTSGPSELLLTFSADLDFERSAATIRSPSGSMVQLGDPMQTDDPRQLRYEIASGTQAGAYTVSWTAAPKDDHGGRGRFRFEVR